ncbi:DUF2809 domain-containing protein [Microbacterium sp.]|uniref:DUF2809 domain-containing protein n=1 Tax=Microbacterium sp. TaxID=51671 RepID=UPI003F70C38A
MKRRAVAAIALASVVVIGLAVHALLPDIAATDIAGDALYAAAAYAGTVLLAPRLKPWLAASIAGAWCIAVELFQLTGIPLALGGSFPPAMLLLGTVFDARDLVIYVAAVVVAAVIDTAVARPGKLEE